MIDIKLDASKMVTALIIAGLTTAGGYFKHEADHKAETIQLNQQQFVNVVNAMYQQCRGNLHETSH